MPRLKFSIAFFAVSLAILLLPISTNAQVAGASLSGAVHDPNGAAVPNVTVTIKNVATGATKTVNTDETGLFTMPNLMPGSYEVTASASGFKTTLQKDVTLTVGAQQSLDLKLEVGEVSQQVQVNAITTIDTVTPTISAVVAERTIVELPLNGRDWTSLATLQTGISSIRTQYASGGTASRGNRGYGEELNIKGH